MPLSPTGPGFLSSSVNETLGEGGGGWRRACFREERVDDGRAVVEERPMLGLCMP